MTKKKTHVCPICNRRFATHAALEHHERTVHEKAVVARRRPRYKIRGGMMSGLGRLVDSSGFLKCAFAPVDFTSTGFTGIPDAFNGKVFSVHSDTTFTEAIAGGADLYILKSPSPGIAYYRAFAIDSTFTPVYYPEAAQLFEDSGDVNIAQFRFASSVIEVTNNTPMLNIGGNIVVAELPLKLATKIDPADNKISYVVEGMPDELTQHVYADNARNGCYAVCTNQEEEFVWHEPIKGPQVGSFPIQLGDHGAYMINAGATGFTMRGWDNSMSSKIIKITAPTGNNQTISIRSLACVEYRPEPHTLLAEVAMDSPQLNPAELKMYHALAKVMPIAVPRAKNGNFWNFVKNAALKISKMLSFVPGPVGVIAGGVHELVS